MAEYIATFSYLLVLGAALNTMLFDTATAAAAGTGVETALERRTMRLVGWEESVTDEGGFRPITDAKPTPLLC